MHTDEYEISLAREIKHCEQVVRTTKEALATWHQRFGMDYAAASAAVAAGRLQLDGQELAAWREDIEALPVWEQRLVDYREALSVMRISASRF